jgi:hypothetical protein
MAVYRGRYVVMDHGNLELTEELAAALLTLDNECKEGFGGTWDIFERDGQWRASFVDIATDELIWNPEKGSWTDGYDDEDEDEERMLAFVG